LKSSRRRRSNHHQPFSRLLKLRDESDFQSLLKTKYVDCLASQVENDVRLAKLGLPVENRTGIPRPFKLDRIGILAVDISNS